jgi:hypothetical protein
MPRLTYFRNISTAELKVMKMPLVILATGMLLSLPLAGQDNLRITFDVALLGDMPYGTGREAAYGRLIEDVNNQRPMLAVHIGDTKSGSTRCDDSHYFTTLKNFNDFFVPVLYSVGDNEWTDCVRTSNGRYDPVERLDMIRRTYFATNQSLGRVAVELTRQSADPVYSRYRENAMLVLGPAVFMTVHMPGSNNNREYKMVQGTPNPYYDNDQEYTARNAANLAWLRAGFQAARDNRSLGLMILTQANMFENFMDTSTGATHSGFADFIAALRAETKKFDGEVVVVSGDTHYMRFDKPLTEAYPGCVSAQGDCKAVSTPTESPGDRVLNFTRVEVPGDGDVHWVLCHVAPVRNRVFQFEFKVVTANK